MLAPDALASLSLRARLFSIRLQRRMENCPEQCHAPLQRYSSCILNRSGYFSSRKTQTFLIDPFSDDGIKQYLEWFECKQGACIYCQKRIVIQHHVQEVTGHQVVQT